MKGLVLQGGGAKGAYQAGAIRALNERKIYFDCVVGTSIGAINAAFYAVHNFKELEDLWLETDSQKLFNIEPQLLLDLENRNFNKENIKKTIKMINSIIKNRGIDTTMIKKMLGKYISEKRFRRSKIDFGLNTFKLHSLKPVEFFKEDIPEGELVDYIISSAYLPFFKLEKIIDDNYYLDGGFHNDCPVDMALKRGCDEILVIKLWRKKIKYNNNTKAKISIITPSEDLGSIMLFEKLAAGYRMNLGYYDTIKFLDKLDGNRYYLKPYSEEYYSRLFDKVTLKRMIKKYNKGITPKSNKEFIIKILERACKEINLKRFTVYNLPILITKLKYKLAGKKTSEYYDFIKNIKVDFEK